MKLFSVIFVALIYAKCSLGSPLPTTEKECVKECPAVFAPVCGSDGKTYDSRCLLEAENCKSGTDVIVYDEAECPTPSQPTKNSGKRLSEDPAKPSDSNGSSCDNKCRRDFKPVCASNGATFNNLCLLEYADCQAGVKENITKSSDGPCPEVAGKEENPAEGRQEKTELSSKESTDVKKDSDEKKESEEVDTEKPAKAKISAESTKVEELHVTAGNETLPTGSKLNCSNIRCTRDFNPVCGSNNKTYSNECFLNYLSCLDGIKVEKIRSGKCEDPEEPAKGVKVDPKDDEKSVVIEERAAEEDEKSKDCALFCPQLWSPVCGSDGKTYGNECDLNSKRCLFKTNVTLAHNGECSEEEEETERPFVPQSVPVFAEDDNPCPINCTSGGSPVCGSDGKSYSNLCYFNREKCRSNRIMKIAKTGRCDEEFNCDNLEKCDFDHNPVCGTDGVTYSNHCNLKGTSCALGLPDLKVQHEGRCKPLQLSPVLADSPSSSFPDGSATDNQSEQNPFIECEKFCTWEFAQVCGSNGETYDNECILEVAICKANINVLGPETTQLTKAHDGPCN